MAFASSQGLPIAYDDLGQGEPALLFLPGWCANRTVFRDLLSRCSRHRRSLALDWRGHGQSAPAAGAFGGEQLLEDAISVIEASASQKVVPVALAHSGWVAIKLRQKLGSKIPKLVHLDWLLLDPPASLLEALEGMQAPDRWRQTVDQIFELWLHEIDNPPLTQFVREEMGSYGLDLTNPDDRGHKFPLALRFSPTR